MATNQAHKPITLRLRFQGHLRLLQTSELEREREWLERRSDKEPLAPFRSRIDSGWERRWKGPGLIAAPIECDRFPRRRCADDYGSSSEVVDVYSVRVLFSKSWCGEIRYRTARLNANSLARGLIESERILSKPFRGEGEALTVQSFSKWIKTGF
ncbi:hypothetical protein Bbelb_003170 [Branchiostoma belcheri]|nr:hypothetical protein Bbelb_003170 [Branchiostoma belcheri]